MHFGVVVRAPYTTGKQKKALVKQFVGQLQKRLNAGVATKGDWPLLITNLPEHEANTLRFVLAKALEPGETAARMQRQVMDFLAQQGWNFIPTDDLKW